MIALFKIQSLESNCSFEQYYNLHSPVLDIKIGLSLGHSVDSTFKKDNKNIKISVSMIFCGIFLLLDFFKGKSFIF